MFYLPEGAVDSLGKRNSVLRAYRRYVDVRDTVTRSGVRDTLLAFGSVSAEQDGNSLVSLLGDCDCDC